MPKLQELLHSDLDDREKQDRIFEHFDDYEFAPLNHAELRQKMFPTMEGKAGAMVRSVASHLRHHVGVVNDPYVLALHAVGSTLWALGNLFEDLRPAAVKPLEIWGDAIDELVLEQEERDGVICTHCGRDCWESHVSQGSGVYLCFSENPECCHFRVMHLGEPLGSGNE